MKAVVIGGGLAGVLAAKKLQATLITNRDEFIFLPRLPELLKDEHPETVVPITECYEDVIVGEPEIDFDESFVRVGKREIPYTHLVIATGATPNMPVPGVKKYAHNLYDHQDAKDLKAIKDKRVVVMGAGPTGVEVAVELALKNEVLLLQRSKRILPAFGSRTRSYAHEQLRKHSVQVLTNDTCTKVTKKYVTSEHNRYEYDFAVWAGGLRANTPKPMPQKPIKVNEYLQVDDYKNVWAIGDCAKSGSPLTAQAAQQEAIHAANNILRFEKHKQLKPFHFHSKGDFLLLDGVAVMDSVIHLHGKLPKFIRNTYYELQLKRYKL